MRILETKVYTIEEHPNQDKCFDWIRENWYDLNSHSIEELMESIEALSKEIGGSVDYAISQCPDRGEHITFKGIDVESLHELYAPDNPLTGAFWDAELIEGLKEGDAERALRALHEDTEYVYSDQGLLELCMANEYEFNEDGMCI